MGSKTMTRTQISQILEISLAWEDMTPIPGEVLLGRHRGGRETLLRWLETQLGLRPADASQTLRIAAYARMLDKAGGKSYQTSFEIDRWSTAQALLRRRDGLLLSGWDGKAHPSFPSIVKDLAHVESLKDGLAPCVAERLSGVTDALASGQRLPAHEVLLLQEPAQWPKAWQPIFAKLHCQRPAPQPRKPHAHANTLLQDFEQAFLEKAAASERTDDSLTWWRALSVFTAADAIAASLAGGVDPKEVVILCEDSETAVVLDDALVRYGVPSMGGSVRTSTHPVLQLLPLWLNLAWEPVDPGQLLDFLNLPVSPIPRSAARLLAEAVSEQPGIGGRAWKQALSEIAAQDRPDKAKVEERLAALAACGKLPRTKGMPRTVLENRCAFLAQWAAGYAGALDSEGKDSGLAMALKTLSGQAAALPILAEAFPGAISEPQLRRLLLSIQENGVCLRQRAPAMGGPRWIMSLAELTGPCKRLVWAGLHTGDLPASPWTVHEAMALLAAGVDLDFDRREHFIRRDAERAGMLNVSDKLFAIEFATAGEQRLHPVWLMGAAVLGRRNPDILENLLTDGKENRSWPFQAEKRKPLPMVPMPLEWDAGHHLRDRSTTSAADLEARLGCPLKWVLQYVARLAPSAVSELPSSILLKGNLTHAIMEEVFKKAAGSADEAAKRAVALFEERLPSEAATLAQPEAMAERLEVRDALARSAKAFYEFLHRGNYEVLHFEYTPKTKLFGKEFNGRLDCFLEGKGGVRSVIDLKYAGKKYRDMMEQGKAIQLCIYAAAAAKPGSEPLAAGYFIIDRAQLWTPSASPVHGAYGGDLVEAPSIKETWGKLREALDAAEGWLKTGKVPVRPRQSPEEWPRGADIGLRELGKRRNPTVAKFSVCEYCNYTLLCGLEETF